MQNITHARIHTSFSVDMPTRTLHTTIHELHKLQIGVDGLRKSVQERPQHSAPPTVTSDFRGENVGGNNEEAKRPCRPQKRLGLGPRRAPADWAAWPRPRGTGGGAMPAEPRPEPASASCPLASLSSSRSRKKRSLVKNTGGLPFSALHAS